MASQPRLTRSDFIGLAVSGLGLLWALLAVTKLQPSYAGLFADFGGALPALTQAFLTPWLPPLLAAFAPIVMGVSVGFDAPGPLRTVASFVAALFTFGQMAGFMVAMYLPVFALAGSIK